MNDNKIPYISPSVQHIGLSRLRQLTGRGLRDLDKTLVLCSPDEPLAVLMPYKVFIQMQEEREKENQCSVKELNP